MRYHPIIFLILQFLSEKSGNSFRYFQTFKIRLPDLIITYPLINEIESSKGNFFHFFLFSFKTSTLLELGPNHY